MSNQSPLKADATVDAEFYYERLQRAQAIPEAERSPDVAAWLASHAALEAAAAELPVMPAGATLTQPLGGKAALAALIQFLVHSYTAVPATLAHPHITFGRMWPQLPPLLVVSCRGGEYAASPQPLLGSLLQSGLASAAADLELLVRLLLLASLSMEPSFEQPRLGCDILSALEPGLSGGQVAAQLSRQLLKLGEQLESSGSSFKPDLPSVHQLQAVQHSISFQLFMHTQQYGLPQRTLASLLQLADNATLQHLGQQPDSPRYSLERGAFAFDRGPLTDQLKAGISEAVPQFLRAAQLARRQGSDLLLARACWRAAAAAAVAAYPGLSPSETAALAQEADAAYSRCKAVLPPGWHAALRFDKGTYKTMEAVVRAHLARSPNSWQLGIHRELQQQALAGIDRHRSSGEARPTCDACGLTASSLRRCAGCKVKQYCSRACQAKDWKEGGHKAQCAALAAQRAVNK